MCENILTEQILDEARRQELIDKSKNADNYSPKNQAKGKNRYERRKFSSISTTVKEYNSINMDAFFKGDILEFGIKVHGETDDYVVTVTFEGILRELQREVKGNNNVLNFKCVLRALMLSFNNADVYVSCNCLHPNTKIKLLDGTTPTIEEMCKRFNNGEKLYVYSTDKKGDFKPGEVERVWKTKVTKEFIKVLLDNGEEILTTPEHLYMLRDGSYESAENLKEGQSLMPMYFNSTNGYETVKLNSEVRGWHSIYKLVADYFKSHEIEEAKSRVNLDDNMPYDVAIHHKDFNKKNNNPDNLQIMTAKEHWTYHNSLTWENKPAEMKEHIRQKSRENAIKRNANPTERMIQSRKEWLQKGIEHNYDPEWKSIQAEIMRDAIVNYWKNMSDEEYKEKCKQIGKISKNAWSEGKYNTDKFHKAAVQRGLDMHTPEREKLTLEGIHEYWNNLTSEEKAKRDEITKQNAIKGVYTKIERILQKIIDNNLPLTEDNYEYYRKQEYKYPKITKRFKNIEEAIRYFNLNHKIVKIERVVLEDTPVYDIKVKDWNNFVVNAGVVLHNCADFKYRFSYEATKNQYNSGTPELRPAKITNPNDTKGAGCKHILLVLSNMDWMMKIASVINNYIRYSRDYLQRNYADYIFPVVYGVPYNRAVQLSIFDKEDKYGDAILPTDKETIDDVIATSQQGRDEKGKFTQDNQFKFQPKEQDKNDLIDFSQDDDKQMTIDFEEEDNQ